MTIKNCILKTLDPDNIKVILSGTDNKQISRFFAKVLGKQNVYNLDDGIFDQHAIHCVICLNKVDALIKCLYLAHYLHVPLIIMDCAEKPEFISIDKISPPKITYKQLALTSAIADSWNADNYHDVVGLDISNPQDINKWKQLLKQLSKETFTLDTDKDTNE